MSRTPLYELHDVAKTYQPRGGGHPFTALSQVSLRIPHGSFVTVRGPSGSGKSTLLSLLGLLDRPTAGALHLDGRPVGAAADPERCALRAGRLAFVFQAFHLIEHRTVLDNVMLGGLYRGLGRAQRRAEALGTLERVGLASKANGRAGTLSGGERQRTAIARALVGDPAVLLCDEPTGNLDSANGAAVVALIEELAATGLSVVMVTHDPELAGRGTQQLQVIDGRVTGDGCG